MKVGDGEETRQPEAEEHGSKDRGDTAWWKLVCMPSKRSVSRAGHHKDLSAPRYPAGARAGAAPDLLGVEAVALYATCTGSNVSPDTEGGCPRSPSADVSALRKRSARCGASLQRLTTGSPTFRLAYWSCRARLGILGSGRTCGWPRPRSQTAHPLGFGRSDGRRRLLRYRTDVE